ncbi:MAG: heme ABC transporter permease [Pseudomonadota bacterium]
MLSYLANPERFTRFSRALEPVAWGLAAAAALCGAWAGLFASPPDYQQGESVRIMYVHVPAAWMSLFVYATMAGAALSSIIWRHSVADEALRAAAPIGAAFTALALLTGALWGKPTWGTWWQWDARMTSVLVLFFIYVGIIALRSAVEDEFKAARAAAVLTLLGAVNLPIVKFSVDWWNTLHQPASVIRADGPSIPLSMLAPLFAMALAYMALYAALLARTVRTQLLERSLARRAAKRAPSAISLTPAGEAT